MAMKSQPGKNSRFTDVYDEPVDHLLSPVKGYETQPLLSLSEAIQPVSAFFNRIENNIFVALHNCQNPQDGLTQQESAAIHLYTMQFVGGPSLYLLLNQSLRAENRDELIPWFSFLHLFLTALHKLPSHSGRIWRGVRDVDLSSKYKTGTKFAWWGVISCTSNMEILEPKEFLGKTGQHTLFSIECIDGKSVVNHSHFNNTENEIILMPGSYFEVVGQLNPAPQLHIIQLKEIPPPITLVQSPLLKSDRLHSTSTVQQPNTTVQSTSNSSSNILSKGLSIKPNSTWKQHAITVAGGNGLGDKLNQLCYPYGLYIDDHQNISIADMENHRIMEWNSKTNKGRIVAGENARGSTTNRLDRPTDVIIDKDNNSLIISDYGNRRVVRWSRENNINGEIIIENIDCSCLTMDKNGDLYVADWRKNEVRRWKRGEESGKIIAGGNGQENHLNQLNGPSFIFVDEDYSLFISDQNNHRVTIWIKDAKEGIVVAGGNGEGERLSQLCYPRGMKIDQLGQIYVADCENHRVMLWCQGDKEGTVVVGGNGKGDKSNQLNGPAGLTFDEEGNLYVADCFNDRIQKFEINTK